MSAQVSIHKPRITADKFDRWVSAVNTMKQAADAFSNPAARTGYGTSNLLEGTNYPLTRLSFNYILMQSLYRSNWIIRKVVDLPAEDMTKAWMTLSIDAEPKQMKRFEMAVKKTGTENQMLTTLKWARLFGGAGGVIILKGHEKKLDQPLELDDVEPDSYRGIIPLDRWSGIIPDSNVSTNIDHPLEFGLPEYYRMITQGGRNLQVHASRVVRFIGKDLPVWEKQVEQNWGISEVEVMFDELKKRDNTSWNIASLIFRANIVALKSKSLDQMLSGLGAPAGGSVNAQQRLFAALQAQSQLMSNQGMMILPEEGGLEEHQYSFGGVADVYEAFREDICGATGIPYSRMFGRTPGGLSTTNEGEEHIYYESIAAKQQRELDPQATKLFPVIAMSVWGEVPDDFEWKWNPVGSLGDKDKAELGTSTSAAVASIYNIGVISPKLVLKELKQQSGLTGLWTNITDEDIESASDEVLPVADEMLMGDFGSEGEGSKPPDKNKKADGKKDSKSRKEAKDDMPSDIRETVIFAGLGIVIENPVGSVRSGEGWSVKMSNDYGYIVGSAGLDGDAVDCFLGPNEFSQRVFIVHTAGEDPEDKVMLGFDSAKAARDAFEVNYSRRGFFESMDVLSLSDFTRKIFSKKLGKKVA